MGSTTLGSAWGNQEEGKWLDCPKSSGAGCRKVDDTPYDVLCNFGSTNGIRWFSELGCLCVSVWTDYGYYQFNLAVSGSNTARLFSLMRLTTTPTNQGMVAGVSRKYKIRYFRPNEGEEWLNGYRRRL